MAKYLRVTMPDGSKWDVPALPIAEDRARYYAQVDAGAPTGEQFDLHYQKELAYTLNDRSELIDWAGNNMNWSDVAPSAVLVGDRPETDFQEGWCNGEKEIVEHD